mmetsp:Transcript_36955/g.98442  ORF Transcript_36955/g.98442 Transcript_36955/m.98442 type:complete len:223 (+) Transcript_36955:877-1545(+)
MPLPVREHIAWMADSHWSRLGRSFLSHDVGVAAELMLTLVRAEAELTGRWPKPGRSPGIFKLRSSWETSRLPRLQKSRPLCSAPSPATSVFAFQENSALLPPAEAPNPLFSSCCEKAALDLPVLDCCCSSDLSVSVFRCFPYVSNPSAWIRLSSSVFLSLSCVRLLSSVSTRSALPSDCATVSLEKGAGTCAGFEATAAVTCIALFENAMATSETTKTCRYP